MQADVGGLQRKVVQASVHPLGRGPVETGIPLRAGATLPFAVTRQWSAPAGRYPERFFVVHPETREVVLEGPLREELQVWGLQSLTEVTDRMLDPIPLQPGLYLIVFALGGVNGGEFEAEAVDVGEEAA